MPTPEQDAHTPGQQDPPTQPQGVSDELVRKVTDKVYAMLMNDLRIERERHPPSAKGLAGRGGW